MGGSSSTGIFKMTSKKKDFPKARTRAETPADARFFDDFIPFYAKNNPTKGFLN